MPQVLIPIAAAALVGGAGVALGAVTVTAAVLSVAATAVAAGVGYLTRPSAGGARRVVETAVISAPGNQERSVPVAQAVPPRRFAYGPLRTGGTLLFQDNANPYLIACIALCDGVIEAVDAVYFGDTLIPVDANGDATVGSNYQNYFKREWTQGFSDQTASPIMLANFPALDANFRQRGVARFVVRLDWGSDATLHQSLWGDSISPSAQGRFLRVYDPRAVGQSAADKTTWTYSANPVLQAAHAMTNAWGVAVSPDDMDWDLISDAADVCDATVNGLPIFRGAGVFQGDVEFGSQLSDMMTAFRGRVVWNGGKYGFVADAARDPVWTVNELDILEVGEFVNGSESRLHFNHTSATYFDTSNAGKRATTAPYRLTNEIGLEGLRPLVVTLPFTPDDHSAQIIAYRELMQSRDGRSLTLHLTDAALYLIPSEVIEISLQVCTFLNGLWEVLQIDLTDAGAIVVLRGYNPDVYADPSTYLV